MLSRRSSRSLELECVPVSYLVTGLHHSMGGFVPPKVLFRRFCPQPIGSTAANGGTVTKCFVGIRLALLLGGFIAFFITFFGARILLPVRA